MKSLLLGTMLLFLIACTSASAQSDDVSFWDWVSQYDRGYGIEYYKVTGEMYSNNPDNATFALDYICIGNVYGFYFPFMKLGKDLSWGIQPNLTAATGYSFAQGQVMLALSAPVNLMLKYGTDAEYYGKKSFGVGAGIGYRVAGTLMSLSESSGFIGLYHHPTLIAETSLKAGKLGLLKARFMTGLGSPDIDVPLGEDRLDEFAGKIDLSYYALYFIYTYNF